MAAENIAMAAYSNLLMKIHNIEILSVKTWFRILDTKAATHKGQAYIAYAWIAHVYFERFLRSH